MHGLEYLGIFQDGGARCWIEDAQCGGRFDPPDPCAVQHHLAIGALACSDFNLGLFNAWSGQPGLCAISQFGFGFPGEGGAGCLWVSDGFCACGPCDCPFLGEASDTGPFLSKKNLYKGFYV